MAEKADSLEALVANITPEIHENLKTAVGTGRWANCDKLSPAQVEHSLQAIIAYEARHLKEEDRVGYIDTNGLKDNKGPAHHHEEGQACASPEPAPITWINPSKHNTH